MSDPRHFLLVAIDSDAFIVRFSLCLKPMRCACRVLRCATSCMCPVTGARRRDATVQHRLALLRGQPAR
jgi:hypothetical protein